MRSELYQEMFGLEDRHWWFRARCRVVRHLLARYLGVGGDRPRPRIADLGCGCGLMLSRLTDRYDVVGLDASDDAIAFCRQRGVEVLKGFLPGPIAIEAGSCDAVLMLDVLEHLDDDRGSLAAAVGLLKPGGLILCTVPAYPWLWTRRDEHHHHRRRYTRAAFAQLMSHPELHVQTLSYYNSFLFPLALGARLASRFRSSASDQPTDLHVPPAPINRLFESLFAFERHLIGRVPLPAGLSLLAVARRAGGGV